MAEKHTLSRCTNADEVSSSSIRSGGRQSDSDVELSAYDALLIRANGDLNTKREPMSTCSYQASAEKDKSVKITPTYAEKSKTFGSKSKKIGERKAGNKVTLKRKTKESRSKSRRLKRKHVSTDEERHDLNKSCTSDEIDGNIFRSLLTGNHISSKRLDPKSPEQQHPEKEKFDVKMKKRLHEYQERVVNGKGADCVVGGKKLGGKAIFRDLKDAGFDKNHELESDYETGSKQKLASEIPLTVEEFGDEINCSPFKKYSGAAVNREILRTKIDFDVNPFSSRRDSVQNGSDAFQWLIRPFSSLSFFTSVFQCRFLHISRGNPNYYGNLFSTEEFIKILKENYVEYGTNVNIAVYKDQKRSTLNGVGKVYPADVKAKIQAGCSVQFTNPQSFSDRIWYYCDSLQELFACFVGANTYITPANTSGFAPHWDDIDAFLLQLEGRKFWKVYAPTDEDEKLPRIASDNFTDDDLSNCELIFADWLEQGDLLYVPRGFIHQGIADSSVHSLHLTVSVCRNTTYGDLLDRVVSPALSVYSDLKLSMRESLPIGYLDMGGVLSSKYPLMKRGPIKLDNVLAELSDDFSLFLRELKGAAVDMMGREFMRTALPPFLTEEEKSKTVLSVAGSSLYDNMQQIFTQKTSIKLLRWHGQRLIFETEESCFIVHRMANSRVYEERPDVCFDVEIELVKGFANLLNAYPNWCHVSDLKCDKDENNIKLASLLYNNGLIMAIFENTDKNLFNEDSLV